MAKKPYQPQAVNCGQELGKQTDVDPDTCCMEVEIAKGRFSFRLTAPYGEERRQAASDWAKKNGIAAL